MASILFVDYQTVIPASWLNDVNNLVYSGVLPANSLNVNNLTVNTSVAGSGFVAYLASPPAIGAMSANTGEFTLLQGSSITATTQFNGSGAGLTGSAPNLSVGGTASNVTGIVAIANGGTGNSTANAALNAFLPSQTGKSGYYLTTDGSNTAWSLITTVPSGAVFYFAMNNVPSGYLECNGAAVSRTTFAALFAAIGTTFGIGDGSNTFNLPDLRGQFVRGFDNGRGIDPGRVFGTNQSGAIQSHTHSITDPGHSHTIAPTASGQNQAGSGWSGPGFGGSSTSTNTTGITVNATGSTETRPTNVALLACIKV